jgi:hypothetical protein
MSSRRSSSARSARQNRTSPEQIPAPIFRSLALSSSATEIAPAQDLLFDKRRFFIDVSHQIRRNQIMRNQSATLPNPAPSKPVAQPKTDGRSAAQTVLPPQKQQAMPEEVVRLRAYQKWEAAGGPIGDSLRFWFEAERELSQSK